VEGKDAGVGAAYVYNKDYLIKLLFEDGEKLGWISQDSHYLQLGYGTYLIKNWNLALGVSGKAIYSKLEIDINDEDKYGLDEKLDDDILFDLDLGIHWSFGPSINKFKMFSIGCLVQDIFESEFRFKKLDLRQKYQMNVRPGFCFRPDDMSIISLEIYDASSKFFDEPQIRIGAERWFGFGKGKKILALRAGGYHLNGEDEKAYTFGFGWGVLSYTLISWDKIDKKTHLVGLSVDTW